MTPRVLVTGATGRVGRATIAALRGAELPVAAFVRDPDRAREILGPDIELRAGDLGDEATLTATNWR
jgi:uncharacterized protein YbjT (DUF2867 family)